MLWKVLRPRWWLLRRQFTRPTARDRVGWLALAALVIGGGAWVFTQLLDAFSGPVGAGRFAALLPLTLTGLLFFALIQLADALYQLYLAPDMEPLLVAPLPRRDIFMARLLTCTQTIWLPAILATVGLVAIGVAQSAPAAYYPLVLALVAAAGLLVTAISLLVVMTLTHLIPPRHARELLPVALGVASLGGVVAQQVVLQQLAALDAVMRPLAAALLDPERLALVVAVVGGVALAAVELAEWVFSRTVSGVWGELRIAPVHTNRPAGWRARPGLIEVLTRCFPAGQRPLLLKEWRLMLREPQRLTNLVLVPAVMAVLFLPMLADSGSSRLLSSLGFWLLLIYASLFGLNSAQGVALPSLMLEGRRFLLLRQTPLAMRDLLWAKLWAAYWPMVLVWAIAAIGYGAFLRLPAWQVGALALTQALGLVGSGATFVAISALGADFSAAIVQPKLGGAAAWLAWLGLLLGGVAHLSALALTTWGVLTFAAGAELVAVTRAAMLSVAPLAWLIDGGAWRLLAIAGLGQAVTWLAAASLWRGARRRLETWQPT